MDKAVGKGIGEVVFASVAAAIFYLLAAAVFAVVVKAYAPSQAVVTTVNWTIKGVGAFVSALIFVHEKRALVKGAAAGAAGCILAMLLFAAIGGGFRVTAFFPLELLYCAVLAALGAILGAKLRKES